MAENVSAPSAEGIPRPGDEGEPPALEVGDTFELLAERRDRYVLYYLYIGDGIADLERLAERVLAWEAGDRPTSLPPARVKAVVAELAVDRLPRLRSAGLLEYNPRTGCVVATPEAETLDPYLEAALGEEPAVRDRPDPFVY